MQAPATSQPSQSGRPPAVPLAVVGGQLWKGAAGLLVALDAAEGAGPIIPRLPPDQLPQQFKIFQPGPNPTNKGVFIFDQAAADAVIGEYRAQGIQKFLDWEHAAATDPPQPAPAAGWCDLEVRNTPAGPELWAVGVRWTERAAEHLMAGEYRHFSPWMDVDPATGRVLRLRNLALVNYPATQHQQPLVAASATATDGAQAMRTCPSCGSQIADAAATTCPGCGAQLTAAAAAPAAPAAAAAPPAAPAAAAGPPAAAAPGQKCSTCGTALAADQPVACLGCMERATAAAAGQLAAAQGLTAAQLSGRAPAIGDVMAQAAADAQLRVKVLQLTGAGNAATAQGALVALKAAADAMPGLQQRVLQLEADALISKATADGKLAPGQHAWARGLVCNAPTAGQPVAADGKHYAQAGLDQLRGFLGVAAPVVQLAGTGPAAPATDLPVPGEITQVARMLRVDPADVVANIKARTGQPDVAVALSGRFNPGTPGR